MNGFITPPLAAVAAALAIAAAAVPAQANQLSATIHVSLTILPGAQTQFEARRPAGSRFAVTDDGGQPLDLTDVHVYVREAGTDRRYVDARAAETAILAAQRAAEGPVVVTLVF